MNSASTTLIRGWLCWIALAALWGQGAERDFVREVRPILSEKCFACHGPGDEKGDLRLDRPNEAVLGKRPEETAFWKRVTHADADERMPPPESHKTLDDAERKTLYDWLASGAEYKRHWAYQPLAPGASIDAEIPNQQPPANPRRQIRRLALDLIGTSPELADVRAFAAGKISYESLVDKYLASPHFGETMARPWLDAARYSDTHGLQNDYYRSIWPYRDWVVKVFNDNVPFDQFSIRQLAGDLLPEATDADRIATGFLKCNASTNEGGIIDEEYRIKYLGDRTKTVSTVWLGLTAECAACHDHKYDPIRQKDYYALSAFFANVNEPVKNGDTATARGPVVNYVPDGGGLAELLKRLPEPKMKPAVAAAYAGAPQQTGDLEILGAADPFTVSAWVIRPGVSGTIAAQLGAKDGYRGWNLLLQQRKLTVQIINAWPRSAIMVEAKDAFAPNEPTHVAASYDGSGKASGVRLYLNGEPQEVSIVHDSLQGDAKSTFPLHLLRRSDGSYPLSGALADFRLYRKVLDDAAIALLPQEPGEEALAAAIDFRPPQGAPSLVVAERTGRRYETFVLDRGDYSAKIGEPLQPDVFTMLPPYPKDWKRDRLGFAKWLFLPENPLTARVTVNRIWAQFFGEGIVATANDFGNQGAPPTNLRLLDYLAARFQNSGWDVKALVREIVTSDAYRQGSRVIPGKSRAPRHRLDAEVVRDNALAISGLLARRVGGPTVRPYQPPGVWMAVSTEISDTRIYKAGQGEDLYRRSIYTIHKRTANPPIMANFDAPTREECVVQRERTNTPLQALQLMNDVQFFEAARALASRAQFEPDPLGYLFERATCRLPTDAERRILQDRLDAFKTVADPAVESVGESDAKAPPEWVLLANLVLNLDEVICK